MRHVGASPPADSAAGASSLCSSSQTRAAAAKATTHPRSESGKSMRRSESKFEGCLIIQVTRFTHERQGRSPSLALALWWRSLSTLSGGGSVRRSLALSHGPGGRMVAGLCRMMVAGIRIAFLLASEGAFLPQLPFSASGSS